MRMGPSCAGGDWGMTGSPFLSVRLVLRRYCVRAKSRRRSVPGVSQFQEHKDKNMTISVSFPLIRQNHRAGLDTQMVV